VRQFLLEYRRRHRPIMILTSHYMEDIESLCERIVIMNQGEIVFDGPLADVRPQEKIVIIDWVKQVPPQRLGEDNKPGIRHLSVDNLQSRYLVHRDLVPDFTARLLAQGLVSDLSIEEPDVGRVIEDLMMRKGSSR
jgi:ABC-2 type transport system ATP-binding protein